MAAVLACGEGAVLSHTSAAALWGFLKPFSGPIHVTNPQRTIDDLEGIVEPYLVRRAIRQAEHFKIRLNPSTRARTLRTRSDLELAFLAFCARHSFPRPEVNVKVGRWEVDFPWPSQKVAVETDFFDYHHGSVPFEDDHQRELDLRRLGYTVRRYTGAQIRNHPALVVADLGEALRGGANPGS
jgi:very-short-patch-repair endonuclease